MTARPEVVSIDRASELDQVAEAADRAGYLALDTESNSLYVYREQVCFMQVEAGGQVFVIDTLGIDDLGALLPVLADPGILTILHGADYDVTCLDRDFGARIEGLFDTMIAARFLGYEHLGLAALVDRYFGEKLDKSVTRYNWGIRPLEERYLRYLVDDVVHLSELEEILRGELEGEDLVEEVEIEFQRVSRLRGVTRVVDPEGFRRIKGASRLDARGLAILRELYLLRESLAERVNRPPFKVLGNHQLLDLATRPPRRQSELERLRGAQPRLLQERGPDILEAVARGVRGAGKIPRRPPSKGERPSPRAANAAEALRRWRRKVAEKEERPTMVILPNPALETIARLDPRSLEELAAIEDLGPKRARRHGEAILEILRNANNHKGLRKKGR